MVDCHALVGRCPLSNRPDATIGEVREGADGLLFCIRWGETPVTRDGRVLGMTAVQHTWLRCTERDPEIVLQLTRYWHALYGECDDSRITDAEPPPDVPCGGWLSPEGRLWRGSDYTHPIMAMRIASVLGVALPQSPREGIWDAARALEARAWIHLQDNGDCGRPASITQAQRDSLFDYAMRFPAIRERILWQLKQE